MAIHKKFKLREMSHVEVGQRLEECKVIVIPVGAIEQHGPHLPLDVDARFVEELASAALQEVVGEVPAVLAPTIPFGCSHHHMDFAGSLTLSFETFIQMVYEIGQSLLHHGFNKIILLNGHSGNAASLQVVANKLRLLDNAQVLTISHWNLAKEKINELRESPQGGVAHACEYETSLYLYLDPAKVNMGLAERVIPNFEFDDVNVDLVNPGLFQMGFVMKDYTDSGVIGDATLASIEKGEAFFTAEKEKLKAIIKQFHFLKQKDRPIGF